LAQLFKEPDLIGSVKLLPQQFSSPLLGKAFGLMQQLREQGRTIGLSALSGEFTSEEMNHLTAVCKRNDSLVSETALKDCANKIRNEYEKSLCSGEDALRSAQERLKAKKGYGG